MQNLTYLLIVFQSSEHRYNWDCLLASNQIADEIGEAPIDLLLVQQPNISWIPTDI